MRPPTGVFTLPVAAALLAGCNAEVFFTPCGERFDLHEWEESAPEESAQHFETLPAGAVEFWLGRTDPKNFPMRVREIILYDGRSLDLTEGFCGVGMDGLCVLPGPPAWAKVECRYYRLDGSNHVDLIISPLTCRSNSGETRPCRIEAVYTSASVFSGNYRMCGGTIWDASGSAKSSLPECPIGLR